MNKLMNNKPVLHAVLWIVIYIVLVNIGDALSAQMGIANLATALLLIALSIGLVWYLKSNNRLQAQGFQRLTGSDLRKTLYYAPLILLALLPFSAGLDPSMPFQQTVIFCLLMAGVGLIEELLFRGLLFQGIYQQSGVNRAVFISGITFGMGHIVNLLRGYGAAEQMGQIVVAIAIGIVLALLVALTRNLLPGILFHIVFNIGGSITNEAPVLQTYLLIVMLVICIPYAIYLFRLLQKEGTQRKGAASTLPDESHA